VFGYLLLLLFRSFIFGFEPPPSNETPATTTPTSSGKKRKAKQQQTTTPEFFFLVSLITTTTQLQLSECVLFTQLFDQIKKNLHSILLSEQRK